MDELHVLAQLFRGMAIPAPIIALIYTLTNREDRWQMVGSWLGYGICCALISMAWSW